MSIPRQPHHAREVMLSIDLASDLGRVTYGATGFLYGLGDPGIPALQMLAALKPQVAAQKAPEGLQHPNGDAFKVAPDFAAAGGKQIQIYVQDVYGKWPYENLGIGDYLPRLEAVVRKSLGNPHRALFVWVPLNEPDAIWYNGRELLPGYLADWKACVERIRAVDPNARIAGPNCAAFSAPFMSAFFKYAKQNGCLPDVVSWHELQNDFFTDWENHFSDFRAMEKALGLAASEVCINEYARINGDLAMPGKLVQFISRFEAAGVTACLAYWTTAGGLNDLVTGNTKPTGAWWLYKWYGDLTGKKVKVAAPNPRAEGLQGLAAYDAEKRELRVIFGGADGDIAIELRGFAETELCGGDLRVALWRITTSKLEPSIGPQLVFDRAVPMKDGLMRLEVPNTDSNNAYLAVVSPDLARPAVSASALRQDAAFADVTPERARFTVDIPEDGYYNASFIYSGSGRAELALNLAASLELDFGAGKTAAGDLERLTVNLFLGAGINIIDVLADKPGAVFIDGIRISASSGPLYELEAEAASNAFGPQVRVSPESLVPSGKVVVFPMPGRGQFLRFGGVKVPRSGRYRMVIHYSNGELGPGAANYNTNIVDLSAIISANGVEGREVYFRNTLGWDRYSSRVTDIELKAGENSILFFSPKGRVPTLDKIVLADPVGPEAAARNLAPRVQVSAPASVTLPDPAMLEAQVQDDAPGGALSQARHQWKQISGPGPARLETPERLSTRAEFADSGEYRFEFTAGDGNLSRSKQLTLRVLPAGTKKAE